MTVGRRIKAKVDICVTKHNKLVSIDVPREILSKILEITGPYSWWGSREEGYFPKEYKLVLTERAE